jgi:alpha-tubulin suppressor-like RCC1 family protein
MAVWRAAVAVLAALACTCLSQPPPPGGGDGDGGMPRPPSSWRAVSGGAEHTCGIHTDGTMWCWGRNDFGQLGTSSNDVEDDVPTRVGSASTWTAVSAGGLHTCALGSDFDLWCWGDNIDGQLGIGSGALVAYQPAPLADAWIAVAAGGLFSCGIHTDGTLLCWGNNGAGEVGSGSAGGVTVLPVPVVGAGLPPGWLAVAAGNDFACAIGTDHSLWCWGQAAYDSLGSGTGDGGPTPTAVPVDDGSDAGAWQQVAAGGESACAIAGGGKLRCWGLGTDGQLGDDNTNPAVAPTPVDHDAATWSAVAVGQAHACGIHTDGSLYCWGANSTDQLAATTVEPFQSSPVAVASPTGRPWSSLGLGFAHTCAIDADAELWCAGQDGGQLGSAGGGARTAPERIGSATAVAVGGDAIGSTGGTACAIDGSAHLWCWGNNVAGEVGDGTTTNREAPVAIGSNTWAMVAVADHTCAIDDGEHNLWCWGNDGFEALGDGRMSSEPAPVMVSGMQWSSVTVHEQTCAIDSTSDAYCWGLNTSGQAAQDPGSASDVGTPGLLGFGDPWRVLAAGQGYTCGISGAGSNVACWGVGTYSNGPLNTYMPNTVPGLAGVTQLAIGGLETCVGVGSAFACFGENDHGQLGNQTSTEGGTATPQPLPGTWQQVSVGENHACGVAGDGTLWCWGANAFGELGVGTFVEYHEPRQVGSSSNWANVAAGIDDTCAVTTTNDLYCWGRNLEGEVGDGSAWRTALLPVP